ncbi:MULTISPECIES: TonB family protein [unclassified Methylibium]|uniref:energy transducer TonB n=1 Tax=unclassified Methylibium TaxID=2633235 RepID=UPI0006F9BDF6|nr:TonB family protein [Methylibium sp. Root1272]KQW69643.1 energy transducer TonB [Methylibium sp. Root1272]
MKLIPQRWAERLRRLTALHVALLISFGVHAVLLTVRFVDPEGFNRVFKDTPLEVILVNARSSEPPLKAQAIAQAALAGGGEAQAGRATSPLPPSALTEVGDSLEDARQQIQTLQEQQMQLLAQIRRELARLPPPDPQRDEGSPDARAQAEQRQQMLQMLAEIEKRINEANARPKKRYVSPSTSEAVYAVYYDVLRRKIEERGTQNFPEDKGRKLYGELTMIVTVDALGQVLDTEIVQSSGQRALDRRAQAIVRAASPFGPFTDAMRKQADQIVVVSRFRFTRDEGFETRLLQSSPQ